MAKNEVLVTSIEGNGQSLDGGSMFGNAPRALWERWYTPDSLGRVKLSCRAMLVELNGARILCETGIGNYMDDKMSERFGVEGGGHRLLKSLHEKGLSPKDIDYVVLSHLHFDHAGGLLPSYEDIKNGNEELLFENAKYVVGKEAFERSLNPHFRDRASFIDGLSKKLEASGRLIVLDEGESIPGFEGVIEFFISEGHTPGQMLTIVHGQSASMMFCGDLVPGTPWVNLPITMGYDRFPEQLINEKQEIYKRVLSENWFLFYTHDPVVSSSRIQLNERNKYEAIEAIEILEKFSI